MRELWRRIKGNWNRTDTVLQATNLLALVLFIGNCWWKSLIVTYVALCVPLCCQALRAWRVGGWLREGLLVGAIIGACWPPGEWLATNVFGWWGHYTAPGPRILDTALYCVLVGWLATTHIVYVGRRTMDLGYGKTAAVLITSGSAFFLGLVGENLFVASGMWVYDPSEWDLWAVPAFVPIAYGIGYAILPFVWRLRTVAEALVFGCWLFISCAIMGVLTGFWPR